MQHRRGLRFALTDIALNHAIDVLDHVSHGERCAVGWDLLMTELERRQDGGSGEDIWMPSRIFDKLPSAAQDILGDQGSVDDRRAA